MLEIRIRLKILEIMNLALEKNNESKNTVFINFMGHCSNFCISIHYDGWKNNKEPDYRKNIYFNDLLIKEKLKELDEIIEVLKNLRS